jgi:6-carboxyhexanoate--CoA ligase
LEYKENSILGITPKNDKHFNNYKTIYRSNCISGQIFTHAFVFIALNLTVLRGYNHFIMKNLWSIRMRASKTAVSRKRLAHGAKEIHISGAEGLYEDSDIQKVVKSYVDRALAHSKGKADKITVTIEEIKREPIEISSLPISTLECDTPSEAEHQILHILFSLGISKKAVDTAFTAIRNSGMRGATIITAQKGIRLEPDKKRGVRASKLGITKPASRSLSLRLARHGINTDVVKEALILASKVMAHRNIVAELCVSDDPDYTTGYVASKKYGYIRIPHIKKKGSRHGGRTFFMRESADAGNIIHYLEETPVIMVNASACKGVLSIDEILDHTHL